MDGVMLGEAVLGEPVEFFEDVAEALEDAATLQGEIEPLTFSEWLSRTLDLFSEILRFVMGQPLLRFFAVFGVFWVAMMLCLYFLRTGRALAR